MGVSGGPDSMALLHILYNVKEDLGIRLFVCHLNHMIRGAQAKRDEDFVSSFCKRLGIPLKIGCADVPSLSRANKLSLEDAGRRARYAFFDEAAKGFGAGKIALGHNADDNVETVLMRLITGSGARGLLGIPPKRGKIIRPIIECWRGEIESYCRKHRLNPRIDKSNFDTKYLRNRIRHQLIPLLKKFNPNVKSAIAKATDLLAADYEYLMGISGKALHGATIRTDRDTIALDIDKLLMYPDPIRRYVLRLAIEEVKGDLENIAFSHIEDITNKLPDDERWEIHLPSGIFAKGDGDKLEISRIATAPEERVSFRYGFKIPGTVSVKEAGVRVKAAVIDVPSKSNLKLKDKNKAILDLGKVGREAVVRSRREGDKFSPFGISGTKKIKDFLIDEKVPKGEKDLVPIVEVRGRIAWVAGMRMDNAFKITNRTKKAVKFTIEPLRD